jgi:hypothetical protein
LENMRGRAGAELWPLRCGRSTGSGISSRIAEPVSASSASAAVALGGHRPNVPPSEPLLRHAVAETVAAFSAAFTPLRHA